MAAQPAATRSCALQGHGSSLPAGPAPDPQAASTAPGTGCCAGLYSEDSLDVVLASHCGMAFGVMKD